MSALRDGALAAEVYLRIDAARKYGIVKGGPAINVGRCEEVIAEAKAAGITYDRGDIHKALIALLAGEQR